MNMTVRSSDMAAEVFRLGADLSHIEFRILMLISECPDGDYWQASTDFLKRQGRLHYRDLQSAAESLKVRRGLPFRLLVAEQFIRVEMRK